MKLRQSYLENEGQEHERFCYSLNDLSRFRLLNAYQKCFSGAVVRAITFLRLTSKIKVKVVDDFTDLWWCNVPFRDADTCSKMKWRSSVWPFLNNYKKSAIWIVLKLKLKIKNICEVLTEVQGSNVPNRYASFIARVRRFRSAWAAFGRRALSIAGTTVWNELPNNVRKTENITTFKRVLKAHPFKLAYVCWRLLSSLTSLVKHRWTMWESVRGAM